MRQKTGGEYLPKNAAGVQHTRNGQELKKAGERKKGGQWKDEERKEGIGKRAGKEVSQQGLHNILFKGKLNKNIVLRKCPTV